MNKIEFTDNDVLLVIDPQVDFCPGGALAVAGGDQIIMPINMIARKLGKVNGRVIATQDWHPANQISFASRHKAEPFSTIKLPYGDQVLWPDHCVQGTPGADFHKFFDTKAVHAIIRKGYNSEVDSYSGFFENDHMTRTGLHGLLKGMGFDPCFSRVFIVGLALDYCVRYTAEDSSAEGFETFVIEDLTRGIAPESVAAAKKSFDQNGIKVIQADDIV